VKRPLPNQIHNEGILLVNKVPGKTSFFPVNCIRRLTGIRKVGHTGTLDPFASGLLIFLIGQNYTRLSDRFLNLEKEYFANVYLGKTTDSYDIDGEILSESPLIPTLQNISDTIKKFQGEIEQIPPMFSAKKVKGKKLYELARKGITIERKPCLVTLKTELLNYEYPFVKLRITCSKGTYIRSIAHDFGNFLDCGAHLHNLERTRIGPFSLTDSISSDMLENSNFDISTHVKKVTDPSLHESLQQIQ
jgi:tRNA pseudouridine55 synthase